MSRSPFARSLAFALGAAAALFVGAPLLTPAFGERAAVRFLLVAAVVAYAALLAPSRSRGARAAALAAGLGALSLGIRATALATAALLGVCRSGILFRARPARAVLLEGLLLAVGLAIAAFLAGPWLVRPTLATWGFWLVQSAFFAIGGIGPRLEEPGPDDPFERARAQVLALLD